MRELGRSLQVCPEIIAAPPTDGLWQDGRSDEQQLGASYEELEQAMAAEAEGKAPQSEREHEVLSIYRGFQRRNRHKMRAIPVFRVAEDQ